MKLVILDRDGVINFDSDQYIKSPNEWKPLPGSLEAIAKLTQSGYKVVVGEVAHPMLDNHYIEWIELIADGITYRQYLTPGQAPEAEFCVQAEKVTAREYCNLHGHWKAEN